MANNNRKVVLIGTGMVGMSFAYAALNQSVCDELVLIDLNDVRAKGEAMDLNHGLAFSNSSMKIYFGDYSDCSNANIAVICAGVAQKPGETTSFRALTPPRLSVRAQRSTPQDCVTCSDSISRLIRAICTPMLSVSTATASSCRGARR